MAERQPVFLKTADIPNVPLEQRAEFVYGTRPMVFAPEAKPVRKMVSTTERLQAAGIFVGGVTVSSDAILHGQDGNPTFIALSRGGDRIFTNVRVAQHDGQKAYSNSDFKAEALQQGDVRLVTGVCLFGAATALGETTDGRTVPLTDPTAIRDIEPGSTRVTGLSIDRKLHPYEAETILRINAFTGLLNVPDKTLSVHIPRLEYCLYGVDFNQKGILDRSMLSQWINEVDSRADGIGRLMERRATNVGGVEIVKPLAPIEGYIREAPGHNIDEAAALLRQADPLWAKLLDRTPPGTFTDLGYLSYIHAYLRLADGGPVIAVENPEEQTILVKSKDNMDMIGPSTIVGFYPHPEVVVRQNPDGEPQRRLLFFYPNHNGRTITALAEITRTRRDRAATLYSNETQAQ